MVAAKPKQLGAELAGVVSAQTRRAERTSLEPTAVMGPTIIAGAPPF
jgi:hypothetical protein